MGFEDEEKRPTLRDLAHALNIHYTTVGKALNNHPRISKATRDRVHDMARDLGYRPNPLVSALMAHKRSTSTNKALTIVAVVISGETALRSKVIKVTCASLETRAKKLGFVIEYFRLDDYDHDLRALCRVLYARGIPCLLLTAVAVEYVKDFSLFDNFCCVSIQDHYGAMPTVIVDHFQCMELMCRRLAEGGFTNPGLIITPSFDGLGMNRVIGAFRNYSAEVFRQPQAPILLESECVPDHLAAWLKRYQPDVLIESWRGVRQMPKIRSQRENHELNGGKGSAIAKLLEPYPYVLLDCIEEGECGISQNREVAGRKAMDVLAATLQRNERGLSAVPHRLMVEGSWVGELPQKSKSRRRK